MPPDLSADEWERQARRDLQAAEHLLQGDFAAHATVLAHLAVEKMLKALYRRRTGDGPPVTHDLRVLAGRLRLDRGADDWTADLQDALDDLSDTSLLALYAPDRPFGHPVSEAVPAARERVAAARTLVTWVGQKL
jgi:HEPN domain-containing protein